MASSCMTKRDPCNSEAHPCDSEAHKQSTSQNTTLVKVHLKHTYTQHSPERDLCKCALEEHTQHSSEHDMFKCALEAHTQNTHQNMTYLNVHLKHTHIALIRT